MAVGIIHGMAKTGNGTDHNPMAQESSRERIELLQRRALVLDMRMSGKTLTAIGKEVGVTAATVLKDIRHCLREMYDERIDKAEELQQLQLARYEKLIDAWWDKALSGNVAASHIVLTTLARIDSMMGLTHIKDVTDPVGDGPNQAQYSMYELARRLAFMLTQGTKEQAKPEPLSTQH